MIDFWSFWGVLGRFLVVLGLLGGSFGGLGGSWAALGRLLGGLEAVLDRSWAALSRQGSILLILGPARPYVEAPFEGPRGAKMRPKWSPRRTKIDVKNEVEKRCS